MLASQLTIHDGLAARSLIEAFAALALAAVGLSARALDVNLAARSTRGLTIAAAIPAIWIVVQILPTPTGAQSIWAYANEALGRHSWGHISIDPGRTILALAFYLSCISLTLVGTFVARDRHRAELILFILTATTAVTTLILLTGKLGLITTLPDTDDVLSGVSGIGIMLTLASVLLGIERYQAEGAKPGKSVLINLSTLIASVIAVIIHVTGLSIAATFNSALAVMFGVVTFASLQIIRRAGLAGWAAGFLVATMIIAVAMIIVWRSGTSQPVSPLLQFTSASSEAIAMTQRLLSDTRWLGTGAGTFAAALPLYQDLGSSLSAPPSTVAGLAIELGQLMCLFAMAFAIWLAIILYRGALRRRRDSFYAAAAAAVVVVLLGQAFCDASLTNGYVAVVASALIGLGLAQSLSSREIP
jgi:hypothetical protein